MLQDGASPIYGSDAIAGVVNIITKQRQDGFQRLGPDRRFGKGDGFTQDYKLSWGCRPRRRRYRSWSAAITSSRTR